MKLTEKNYFSKKANMEYMSASQYKDFSVMGEVRKSGCEAMAMAKLLGKWEEKPSTAMLVGSYVDEYFSGTLNKFRGEHPEIFTQKGELKKDFQKAEEIIKKIEKDLLFMKYMSGEKQVIMTAELFGVNWKIKMDSYHPDKCIVDLKVMKNINERFYVSDVGYVNFIEYWGYDLAAAIYQEVVRKNTGKLLPFYICCIDKKEYPNFEIIALDNKYLKNNLSLIEMDIERIIKVKYGNVEPVRCGNCNYCKDTKVLTGVISPDELILNV